MNERFRNVADLTAYPVLDGLSDFSVGDEEIAGMTDVPPGTVQRWRDGHADMPGPVRVALTLALAHFVETREAVERRHGPFGLGEDIQVERAPADDDVRDLLRAQESRNAWLPPEDIREGAARFRRWCMSGGGDAFLADEAGRGLDVAGQGVPVRGGP